MQLYKKNSIKHINDDLTIIESGKDEGLIELEGYRYDNKTSAKTGKECYVKQYDDAVDGLRYGCLLLKETGRAPVV